MTKVAPSWFQVPNFKGKQTTKDLYCGCCWAINDKREKLEQIAIKEMKEEIMLDSTPETTTEEVLLESTTEPVRKLASIRKIAAIEPIEGADRIVCATVDGWKLVTQKDNNFKPGDLVVYFEIDSFLPICEKFEFLRKACFKSTKHLGDGFRIKTIKLKGQVSQGLILPLSDFFDLNNGYDELVEGTDLTELLGVKKFEKPLDPRLAGRARGNFPSYIRKTDQERLQNIFGRLKNKHGDEMFEMTMKLDGSSMTAYVYQDRFGVCSRNLDLEETEDNTFWQVARKIQLETVMRSICKALGKDLAFQGELMGPGVQHNRESLSEHDFYLFDIWDISEQRYFSPIERSTIVKEFIPVTIKEVPYLGIVHAKNIESIEKALELADIKSLNHDVAEGVVFKSHTTDFTFKVINNRFLLNEKD